MAEVLYVAVMIGIGTAGSVVAYLLGYRDGFFAGAVSRRARGG